MAEVKGVKPFLNCQSTVISYNYFVFVYYPDIKFTMPGGCL